MKKLYVFLHFFAALTFLPYNKISAQCTNAQVNWDKLDYYFNNGFNIRPYGHSTGTYVTDAMEQTQKFAIGPNYLTIATSSNAVVNPGNFNGVTGENVLHTGNIAGYTGADVQYNPGANGQTIIITFNTPVTNANFTLYDIDQAAVINVTAADPVGGALVVGAIPQGVTILTIAGVVGKTISDLTNTALGNADNRGTVTITVAGTVLLPVKSITITCTTIGADPVCWLSDINACVTGSFPSNYHQTGNNQPFYGPVTSQPDYFIVTPDNDSAFMVDPATGKAWFLFTDPARDFMNSFAYDPYNKFLYYITEDVALNVNNKALKKYDFNTESLSTVIANLTTLNIPTFNSGVESAAAAYYNGQLFIGFEGGQFNNSNTRESIVFRMDLNGAGVPVNASQVFAVNSYNGGAALHDWADFVIENGILYNYNSRPGLTMVSYEHFNMMTGASTQYLNPFSGTGNAYQSGLTWAGQQYSFSSNTITPYNENGTLGTPVTITSAQGLSWRLGAGDASENYRPKCDFGDAPASYDPYATPATQSPAVHERFDSIRVGPTWDKEWLKRGVSGTDDVDDGIAFTPVMAPGGGGYVAQVSAYNNSGSAARLIAWLDYNGNGIFDASEAITPITVPSSASSQNFWLFWPSTPNTFSNGQSTWLRVRITSQSAAMTTAHATGYFFNGEVEDYRILIDNFPLTTRLINFDAILQNRKVKLLWNTAEEPGIYAYEIERSSDNINWTKINSLVANGRRGTFSYEAEDANPLKGVSYYRLRIIESSGMNHFSAVKIISFKEFEITLNIAPNPANDQTKLLIESAATRDANIYILNMQGKTILSVTKRINGGTNTIELLLPEAIVNGMYIVRITAGDEIIHKKLIVNK